MAASFNFQQFASSPGDQDIVNLQNNLASFEKRLDELQRCSSTSDAATKMATLEGAVNSLQQQVDNAAKSGRAEAQNLSAKFNLMKAALMESAYMLTKQVNGLDNRIQDNTSRDLINECFMHLDGYRYKMAAAAADKMPIADVCHLMEDYCSSKNMHYDDRKKILTEFINHMGDKTRRNLLQLLLNTMIAAQPAKKNAPTQYTSLGSTDLQLVNNFLVEYDQNTTWLLSHDDNIDKILKPRVDAFFRKLGVSSENDLQYRRNNLIASYKNVVTHWRTHYQNVFDGLQPLLKDAVLNIRNTYRTDND